MAEVLDGEDHIILDKSLLFSFHMAFLAVFLGGLIVSKQSYVNRFDEFVVCVKNQLESLACKMK